jgi:adenosylcobinamide kinase/adenosylcobinamide-phosphate guanylyltransferase
MPGSITFITGGSRSGKSRHAQSLAEARDGTRGYIATSAVYDDEMRARVDRHRDERAGRDWNTIEETIDLAGVIRSAGERVLLVDCLTLWVTNLLLKSETDGALIDEDQIASASLEVLDAARAHAGEIFFVTNEVGMGIVPENALARRFRDLAGRCNQVFASAADHAILVVSGLPVRLK